MELAYKLLPLVLVILAYKFPRIAFILFALILQQWVLAFGLVVVSLMAKVRIGFKKMTAEEYEEYKQKREQQNDS